MYVNHVRKYHMYVSIYVLKYKVFLLVFLWQFELQILKVVTGRQQ